MSQQKGHEPHLGRQFRDPLLHLHMESGTYRPSVGERVCTEYEPSQDGYLAHEYQQSPQDP